MKSKVMFCFKFNHELIMVRSIPMSNLIQGIRYIFALALINSKILKHESLPPPPIVSTSCKDLFGKMQNLIQLEI